MQNENRDDFYDFVIIGSGFGGSVSALRLTEKGYRVLVLERGRRFHDSDFPHRHRDLRRFLWLPALRCFGFQQITFLRDVLVLHGSGVGGGSLLYASVLMEPSDEMFQAPGWRDLADWKEVLRPHYDTARRMLGATTNSVLGPADHALRAVAAELGQEATFRPAEVGVFFGQAGQKGQLVPDPYFDGEGPARAGCIRCGGCMIGCRYNAKNTLDRNYLYLAERLGAEVRPEAEATVLRPLPPAQPDGARYEVRYRRPTAGLPGRISQVRARNVIVAAGVLGTLRLLFRCRDEARTLPALSQRLGDRVRTNSEALLGATSRDDRHDYSQGVAITSVIRVDAVTHVEPVRHPYPPASDLIRAISAPLINRDAGFAGRLARTVWYGLRHPRDLITVRLSARWSRRSTILLVMQTEDNTLSLRPGRSLFTAFRRGLTSRLEFGQRIAPDPAASGDITRRFARHTDGIPQASILETLFNIATTAHILGGVPMGRTSADGVVDSQCQVFNYPGLYVVDGSIVPANPGINPSLTIAALAEYAMSQIPPHERADADAQQAPAPGQTS